MWRERECGERDVSLFYFNTKRGNIPMCVNSLINVICANTTVQLCNDHSVAIVETCSSAIFVFRELQKIAGRRNSYKKNEMNL